MKFFYFCFLVFLAHNLFSQSAGDPLTHIGAISCPTQNDLNVWQPERVGQNKVRFWFGGKYLKWTPMAVDVTISMPFNNAGDRAAPQIYPTSINLSKDKNSGDWIIKCFYAAAAGNSGGTPPSSTLTLSAKQCTLDTNTKMVSCKK